VFDGIRCNMSTFKGIVGVIERKWPLIVKLPSVVNKVGYFKLRLRTLFNIGSMLSVLLQQSAGGEQEHSHQFLKRSYFVG
jgi:hypothetical protein